MMSLVGRLHEAAHGVSTHGERVNLLEQGFRGLFDHLGVRWVTCSVIRGRPDLVLFVELVSADDIPKLAPWFMAAGLGMGQVEVSEDRTWMFEVALA